MLAQILNESNYHMFQIFKRVISRRDEQPVVSNATDKAGKMTTEMINEFGIMGGFQ